MFWPKKIMVAGFLVLPLFTLAQEDTQSSLLWSADRKLTWEDYLANPDVASDAAASTSTNIKFDFHVRNNHFTYTVTCSFLKEKSWARFRTNYILAHEQGHFDIAEIFARKLYKALESYSFRRKNYKNDLNNIYTSIMREKDTFQQQYDNETDYSRNKSLQQQWLEKIRELLNSNGSYTGYSKTAHTTDHLPF